jgi:DNA-directed RNA polymerase I, II, and III subunit RPABC1
VILSCEPKAGKTLATWMLQSIAESGCKHLVAVIAADLTSGARKELDAASDVRVEIFSFLEMSFNLMEHKLVPRHRPMSVEEAQAVLQKYLVEEGDVPRIKQSDPVCRWLDVAKGTMMEITRSPGTDDSTITFRIVV